MAYLIHFENHGDIKHVELNKKITTISEHTESDFQYLPSDASKMFFQVIQKAHGYEILGVTPDSYFLHQGRKKQRLELSSYDIFEIDSTKFIFSEKPFQKEANQDTVYHFETFYKFSKILAESKSYHMALQNLLDLILNTFHARRGYFVALEKEDFKVIMSRSSVENKSEEDIHDLSSSLLARVRESNSTIIIDNIHNDGSFSGNASIHRMGVKALACFPLVIRKKMIGFLYLGSDTPQGLFDPHTIRTIEIILGQAALTLENFLKIEKLQKEKILLEEKLFDTKIIGTSPAMQDLFQKIERIAPLDLTILILGETGTGKEMVAREIHKRSLRGDKPFIAINCGAIPENLLESILFGHKKGAFTGAVADKMGKFEAAHGGTIFLDEIAEMPLHLQVKLLRVLQEKVVERVGDLKEQKTDVRVIAATHQILEEMIKKGVFREDLYYRLNEIYLSIPPLRERAGDIVLLAKHFIDKYKGILGTGEKILTEKSLEKILNYPWPGNIRELENIIKRTLVFSNSEEINENHLDIGESSPTLLPLKEAKEKFMRDYVQKVLALQNGNKEKTSKILGISVRTLFRIES